MAGQNNSLPFGIAPGDSADKVITKISNGLGVDPSNPIVSQTYTDLVVAERQRHEAENEAHNRQIYDQALEYGRRIEDYTRTIGNDTYHRFIECVPGPSGRPEDFTMRIGLEVTHHGLFGDTTEREVQYRHPGGLFPDGTVKSEIKNGVETVTNVRWDVPGSPDVKVGDTRTVPAPVTTAAGTAPSTIDPKADGSYGTTSHSNGQDPTVVAGRAPPEHSGETATAHSDAPTPDPETPTPDSDTPPDPDPDPPAPEPDPNTPPSPDPGGDTPSPDPGGSGPGGSDPTPNPGGSDPTPDPGASGPSPDSGGSNHSSSHSGGENSVCPTDGQTQTGSCCPDGGELGFDSDGKMTCSYTPTTQVDVIPPGASDSSAPANSDADNGTHNAGETSNSDANGHDANKDSNGDGKTSDGKSTDDGKTSDGKTSDDDKSSNTDKHDGGDKSEGGYYTGDDAPPSHHHLPGSSSDFNPVVSHSSDGANGNPAGAPMDFGDQNDPNVATEDPDLTVLHGWKGTDPTYTDPVEQQGGAGVIGPNINLDFVDSIHLGTYGSLRDGIGGNPEDPRNYQGDVQCNPLDPSTYGDGASNQMHDQSMVSPTSAEGSGQMAGRNQSFGGMDPGAGSGEAFSEQASGASGNSPSMSNPGTGQDHGSGGQAAGQFNPLAGWGDGNHPDGETQHSVVQPAHHVDADVHYVHLDPLPDSWHYLHV